MSATYRLKYKDAKGHWRGVKIRTTENLEDTIDFVPLEQATVFVSEPQAWACAAKFSLLPDWTEIF